MKKWAVLFGIFIVAVVVLADTEHLGLVARVYDFPYGDKVGHFVLFGILSLLVNLAAFQQWGKLNRTWLALGVSAVLAILIGLEELSQRLFPSRRASIWDLLASYAGVACFTILALWLAARRGNPDTAA